MTDIPAFVVGRRTDVLAWNALGAALIVDFRALPPRRRNFARLVFLDEHIGALFCDQRRKARDIVAFLHIDAGRRPNDPLLAELVGELSLHSQLFRQLWSEQPVGDKTHVSYELLHPLAGRLVLAQEALRAPNDPDQTLVTYTAEPGSPSEAGLRMLASWQTGALADHAGSIAEADLLPPRILSWRTGQAAAGHVRFGGEAGGGVVGPSGPRAVGPGSGL